VPELSKPGGVANYYRVLRKELTRKHVYFTRGSRSGRFGPLSELVRILNDYARFCAELMRGRYNLVHINTSFGSYGVLRDAVFVLLAKAFGCKLLVFFRGWDRDYESRITGNRFSLFRMFLSADGLIVLASEFRDRLREWGFQKKLFLETTVVDEIQFDSETLAVIRQKQRRARDGSTILFLARIEKDKGVLQAVKAFSLIQKKQPDLKLFIAGDGSYLDEVIAYIRDEGIQNVFLTGYVEGNDKRELMLESDIYIFPSHHGEGLPNSVLEAMSFGLPVITTLVGGIRDFFEDGKMGFATQDTSPDKLAALLDKLISDREKRKQISVYNFEYAHNRFMTTQVSDRLNAIYQEICS
jgi:glycosyltransferase involved in cell wall biosynthesis